MEDVDLLPGQEDLLTKLVEASRNIGDESREPFRYVSMDQADLLLHRGLPGGDMTVERHDLDILERYDLVSADSGPRGPKVFSVRPKGFRYYEHMQRRSREPIDQVEDEMHRYIEAKTFRDRHPVAYQEWYDAASQLWGSEPEKHLTSIGHDCREAMHEFAEDLVNEFGPLSAPSDKQKTVARLQAVLRQQSGRLGSTEQPFLEALVAYWGTVSDLVQRQEHGGQKEGEPLVWEDARRVVF